MAQWYLVRGGQEHGPVTDQQLKDLARSGQLQPTHKVRQADMEKPMMAAKVQGLVFGNVAIKAAPPPREPTTRVAATAPSQSSQNQPVAVPTQPPSMPASAARSTKKIIVIAAGATGLCFFLCCGGLLVIGSKEAEKAKAALAEADALWDSGNKSEAVAKYRGLVGHSSVVNKENGPRIFGRLIDSDVEAGDVASAKSLLDEAYRREILPHLTTNESAKLALQKQVAEAAKSKAEEAKNKRVAASSRPIKLTFDNASKLLDDPESFKGKTVQVEIMYVEQAWKKPEETCIRGEVHFNGGSTDLYLTIPPDVKQLAVGRGDYLVVTFVCELGSRLMGNTVTK